MWSAGTEKQGRIFFRNKAAMGTAARRGTEDEPQGNEAGFEFVPGQVFQRRDLQESGQQFFLLRHRQSLEQLKFSCSVLQTGNKRHGGNSVDADGSTAERDGRRTVNRAMGRRLPDYAASRSVNCSRSPHGTGTMSYCLSDVSTPEGIPSASFNSTKHSDAVGRVSRVSIQLKATCLA